MKYNPIFFSHLDAVKVKGKTKPIHIYELIPAKNYNAGRQEMQIDATGFASGVYFYTVNSGDKSVTRKMIVE